MSCVHVLKCAASGDRVQRSFLSDRRLSKHLHSQVNFTLLSICNRRSVRPGATGWLQTHFLVTGACQNIFSTLLYYLHVEAYVIYVVCGSYYGVKGSTWWSYGLKNII